MRGDLGREVVDHVSVCGPRTEHDELGVIDNAHGMAGRPVVEVPSAAGFLCAVGIGDDDLALEHVAPVRCLAQVTVQALQ